MNFKSKYSLREKVSFILNTKVLHGVIHSVIFNDDGTIQYGVHGGGKAPPMESYYTIPEVHLTRGN